MLLMKQTARIISTYAADVSGVCSALYELGGMTVMHDASGCNSTYNTHDEPRWYDMDSMVYISALSEMEAVMGDDRKLVDDIVSVAKELHPGFIAVAGTPIPMVIGTDFEAVAAMIEKESGIPTMGFPTNGMHSYLSGASMAFAGLARRFCLGETEKTEALSVNILGLTPLDFSVNGSAQDIKALLEQNGIEVVSSWAMGSSLEELQRAGAAHVNLVVSHAGLETAKLLKERFGTPYVAGVPVGREFSSLVVQTLRSAAKTGENAVAYPKKARGHFDGVIIGESVMAHSLAAAAALERAKNLRVLCPLEAEKELLGADSLHIHDETDIAECLAGERLIVADPLYKPICPKDAVFVPLAHEAFSGRIFRRDIPDLIGRGLNSLF